jgi:hypothetical protein
MSELLSPLGFFEHIFVRLMGSIYRWTRRMLDLDRKIAQHNNASICISTPLRVCQWRRLLKGRFHRSFCVRSSVLDARKRRRVHFLVSDCTPTQLLFWICMLCRPVCTITVRTRTRKGNYQGKITAKKRDNIIR